MQTQKYITPFVASPTFILFIFLAFIITLLLLNKKQRLGFSKEVALIKSNFEQDLFKTELAIQEETLQYISLELHDNVSHFLTLAKLHLTTCKKPLAGETSEKIDSATLLIAHSLDEIRNISKTLNTENIKNNGLIKTVQQQVEQLSKFEQFIINFTITGTTRYLEDMKEIVLFRIMQESLNNIVKHSKASLVNIRLQYNDDKLVLSIQDNGIGFIVENLLHHENRYSSGLKNIIKRSSLINAIPEILSRPHEGTTINITTPY